ncbi:Ca2+-binding RTX toxin-like protein [Bradyrhizobium sp. GM7.3]
MTGTTGNDVMVGKRGADTFEFASNFGQDIIKDFAARGPAHDTIEFSKGVFDSFASVLSHAAQSGHDVVIATGSDTLMLKNAQLDKLNSHDFHFA